MAQLVKWLAANPDNPSLSSRTLTVKESAKPCRLSSDLHICSMAGVYSYTHAVHTK